ncbi:MAG TPA: hypothetical protein VKW04_19930 [Planctomycetota bacterium]|nr:hypothetical protein [Planctomycetota bacterium]
MSSFVRDRHWRLDLSFLLLLWIASGLLEGRKGSRRIGLAICALWVLGASASLGYSLVTRHGGRIPWDQSGNSLLYEISHAAGILLLFLPPLTLLLRPSLIRSRSEEPEPAEFSDPGHWSTQRLQGYGLGALLIGGLYAGDELMTGSLALNRHTGQISTEWSVPTMRIECIASTSETGPVFVSSLILGESDVIHENFSSRAREFTLGSTAVTPPDLRPGHYIRWLEFPQEPVDQPNILIVRANGRILRVQRRVTLKTLGAVEAALAGAKNMEEVQRRIEALLPPVSGRFPTPDD